MDKIKLIEKEFTERQLPEFKVGDTVKVMTRILEADKVRLHPFEGVVISKKDRGIRGFVLSWLLKATQGQRQKYIKSKALSIIQTKIHL